MLEVTYGKGAFMKTKEDAKKLAEQMVRIGKLANRETTYILTDMNQPLGYTIGNTLEMIEAIKFLKGEELPEDLKKVVIDLGANMIKLAGLGNNIEENKEKMLKQIYNRQAFNKFKEMVKIQGGDTSYLENTEKFKTAKYKTDIISNRSGKIKEIPADIIAKYVCNLGAGRVKKEDKIDMAVGIILSKKNGDSIKEGEKILTIHSNKKIEDANLETFKILIE
jgi:pyrimidine-nucleoside phosphorylase